jgi:two-component system, NtrC family, sensor kinase
MPEPVAIPSSSTVLELPRWDLLTEAIVVKIRWFGLLLGIVYVNIGPVLGIDGHKVGPETYEQRKALDVILSIGLLFAIADTLFYFRQRVFIGRFPLLIALMESAFIGALTYCEKDLESPFRFYYLLSILICGLRYPLRITYTTCMIHCLSYLLIYLLLPISERSTFHMALTIAILIWLTWATSAMSHVMLGASEQVFRLNSALRENQSLLETRIEERTRQLQETQAQLMHQDKMAGFGLLAAGIAHEVGNPLTSISGIIQVLEKRNPDDYTRDKLGLVGGQLSRIQGILRELTTFSRPASQEKVRFSIKEIVDEALNIVKYYKGTKSRTIRSDVPHDLPVLFGVRDQLVQVIFNLVLNAIDATNKGGTIEVSASKDDSNVVLRIRDDGVGIQIGNRDRVFKPYFTTKKQGTGLGLFVTNKIIGEHKGQVLFESEVGKGTTFTIRLPVA